MLGEYKWLTYTQAQQQIDRIGSGLSALGHRARETLVIFAETRAEWMLVALACFKYEIPGSETG